MAPRPRPAGPALARRLPLAAVFALSLVMLFSPGSAVPSGPPNSDKLVHALLFAALALAARYAGLGWRACAAALLAYAAVSEVLQAILPIHRGGSVWDFAADAAGVGAGMLVFEAIVRARARATRR